MVDVCAICLQDLELRGEGRQWLQCQHCFHEACITQLRRFSNKFSESCPVCRADDPALDTVTSMELKAFRLYIRALHSDRNDPGAADDAGSHCRRLFEQIFDIEPRHAIAGGMLGDFYVEGIGGDKREDEARNMYEIALAGGDLEAAGSLGILWFKGLGGEKDDTKAREYLTMAHEGGCPNPHTNCALAQMCERGLGGEKDERFARELYAKLADRGYEKALYLLGRMWKDGRGGVKDPAKAKDLFMRGHKKGQLMCTVQLGILCASTSPKKAQEYFTKAHLGGDCMGTLKLAMVLAAHGGQKDKEDARKLLTTALADKETEAQAALHLGTMLMEGVGGPSDDKEARRLLEKAHVAGEPDASARLGTLLFEGRGGTKDDHRARALLEDAAKNDLDCPYKLSKDEEKARLLFHKAHKAGFVPATQELALLTEHGRGGPKDANKARELYRLADAKGYLRSTVNLGAMYLAGAGGPKDANKARELFAKADELGEMQAAVNLGVLYEDGVGGPKDGKKARHLFEKAANGGSIDGLFNLGLAWETGVGGPSDKGKARELYENAAHLGHQQAACRLAQMNVRGESRPQNSEAAEKLQAKAVSTGEQHIREHDRLCKEHVSRWVEDQSRKVANHGSCHFCGAIASTQCSRCKTVRYCSTVCQRRDFPMHKQECAPPSVNADGLSSGSVVHGGAKVQQAGSASAAHPVSSQTDETDIAMQAALERSLCETSADPTSVNAQISEGLMRSRAHKRSTSAAASSSSSFEGIVILEFSRHPKALQHALMSSPALKPWSAALESKGFTSELPESKAKVFVEPDHFDIAVAAASEHMQPKGGLTPRHVIVPPGLEGTVKDIVSQLPGKEHVKVKSRTRALCPCRALPSSAAAHRSGGDDLPMQSVLPYVVERTFISVGAVRACKISSLLSGSSADGARTFKTW